MRGYTPTLLFNSLTTFKKMKNNYNKTKQLTRQKFNALMLKAFEFGKNDTTEAEMKEARDKQWEKIK